jgi:outer membrane protein assembly factor BamB
MGRWRRTKRELWSAEVGGPVFPPGRYSRILFLVVATASVLVAGSLLAEDWPHWRGPNYDGITRESLPQALPDSLPVLWTAEVGIGFSSFSSIGDRVLTMGHAKGKDTVWCLDADSGEVIWSHSYDCELHPKYYEGGPGGTPTIHEGSVYTLSKRGHAFRFDLESGEIRWSRDLVADHGLELPEWNFACSPFIDENRILLNAGGAGIALSRKTGETVWLSNAETAGYATPVPFAAPGMTHLLHTHGALLGLDGKTGSVSWRFEDVSGLHAADPVLDGKRVILSTNSGTRCIELGANGKNPIQVWKQHDLKWYFNAGVLIDGHLYSISGTTHRPTELVCADATTGETVWAEENYATGGLVATRDAIILLDQGMLTIFPARPDGFEPILEQRVLEGKCWTAPVLANGRIFCRNAEGKVVALGIRKTKP